MQFDSISEFLAMGGYAFYVWLSYGSSALFLGVLLFNSYAGHTRIKKQISQRLKREQRLRQAAEQQHKSNAEQAGS